MLVTIKTMNQLLNTGWEHTTDGSLLMHGNYDHGIIIDSMFCLLGRTVETTGISGGTRLLDKYKYHAEGAFFSEEMILKVKDE